MGVWLDQGPTQSLEKFMLRSKSSKRCRLAVDVVNLAPPAVLGFSPDRPLFDWDTDRIGDVRESMPAAEEAQLNFSPPTFPGVLVGTAMYDEWEDRGWLLINDDDGAAYAFAGNEITGGKDFGFIGFNP